MRYWVVVLFLGITIAGHCHPLIEAKSGYFFFIDSTMQQVYNKAGVDLQISGSYPIWRRLHIYASAEWLEKSGHSLSGNQKTRIVEFPISIGLKPVYSITPKLDYYMTLGPRYFIVSVHNNSPYVNRHLKAKTLGGFLNGGFLFNVYHGLTIDLFGEFSYGKVSFSSSIPNVVAAQHLQIGGLTFGGGVGYTF